MHDALKAKAQFAVYILFVDLRLRGSPQLLLESSEIAKYPFGPSVGYGRVGRCRIASDALWF